MSMDLARLGVEVDSTKVRKGKGDLRDFGEEAERTSRKTKSATGDMNKSFGATAAMLKKVTVVAAAATAAFASVGQAISVIREFESAMSNVSAVTRATTADLAAMRDTAKELGRTTEFSAAQAADGLRFLGMAGFSAKESIASIPAVLDLATASAMGLAEAADISSNVMSGFGIAAEDAAKVTDVLAAASSRANTDVSQLGQAMSTVAPIAAALGMDLEVTASAVGVLSDAGIQGSRAGTALRGVLASLAGPTDQAADALASYGISVAQVNPETNKLADIFSLLKDRGLSTADAMTIFGREAASGALVLADASTRVNDFAVELRGAGGAAADMAGIMRDNLSGDAKSLTSSMEGLALAIGDLGLTRAIRVALQVVTALARELTGLAESVSEFFTAHDPVAGAVLAASFAMQEEAERASTLSNKLLGMERASYDVLGAKVALVETSIRNIEIMAQEAVAVAKTGDEYQKAARDAEHARNVLKTYQDLQRAGVLLSKEDALSVADFAEKLRAAVETQKRIVEEAGAMGPAYDKAVAELELLKAYLRDATGDTVVLNDGVVDTASNLSIAERVAAALEGYISGAAEASADATKNATALQGVLVRAAGAALGLYRALSSAMSALGSVGSGLANLASRASGVVGVTSKVGGMLKGVFTGPTMQGVLKNLADAGTNLKVMHERSVLAAPGIAELDKELGGGGSSSGGMSKSARDAAREAKKLADEIERLEFEADPVKKYNAELAHLDELVKNGLSDGAYQAAVSDLNDEFINSYPNIAKMGDAIGDFVASGLRDFDNLLDSFKGMIKQMISTAVSNPIKLALGMGSVGGGVGGATAAAAAPGGGGLLSGLMGAGGSAGGGLLSGILGTAASGTGLIGGFSSVVSSFGMGGLGGAASSLGAALGGATSGLAGLATAVGAIAAPLLAVAAVFSFFKKKTKELDSGLRITVDGLATMVETFSKVETSRFWGLSKKVRTSYDNASDEIAAPIIQFIDEIRTGVETAAASLGFGASVFEGFAHQLKVSTKGMSEDEAQQAILDAFSDLSDAYANMIPGLEQLVKTGETSTEALQRLAGALEVVNNAFHHLGNEAYDVSLAGAALASSLVDAFGSLEAFNTSVDTYLNNFYTTQELFDSTISQLTSAFENLGYTLPRTREEFRNMVESLDLTTTYGQETYAAFLQLAGTLASVTPAVANLSAELAAMLGGINTGIDSYIASATEAMQANEAAAAQWFSVADSLRKMVNDLRGSAGVYTSLADAQTYNQQRYDALLSKTIGGDVASAEGLADAAKSLLATSAQTSRTAFEQARAEAKIINGLELAAGVGDIEGARHNAIAGLLGQQVEVLEELNAAIAGGADADQIDLLNSSLIALDGAIQQAEMINYQFLKERLSVSVELLADADIPAHLKKLLSNAQNGVSGFIDFIVRDDMSPDQKWLALTSQSEHLKTIDFLIRKPLSNDTTRIVLNEVSALNKMINFAVNSDLSKDNKTLALAHASGLAKTVNYLVGKELPSSLLKIALGQVSSLRHTVNYFVGSKISDNDKRIALATSSVLNRDIRASVASGSDWRAIKLGLEDNGNRVKVFRDVGISASYGSVTTAQRTLLESMSSGVKGTVTVNGNFDYDPSNWFQTWYEKTTRSSITSPMSSLSGRMQSLTGEVSKLTAEMRAEAQRQREAAAKSTQIASLQSRLTDVATTRATNISTGAALINQIKELERSTGVTLKNGSSNALLQQNPNGNVSYKASHVSYGKGDDIDAFRAAFWGPNGLEAQLNAIKNQPSQQMNTIMALRSQLTDLGAVPAYAMGGSHPGGRARIGENDIEMVAPSRVYNPADTKRMLDNAPVVEAVKEVKEELRRFKEENTQMMINLSSDSRKMLRLEEKREEIGTPTYNVEAPV